MEGSGESWFRQVRLGFEWQGKVFLLYKLNKLRLDTVRFDLAGLRRAMAESGLMRLCVLRFGNDASDFNKFLSNVLVRISELENLENENET